VLNVREKLRKNEAGVRSNRSIKRRSGKATLSRGKEGTEEAWEDFGEENSAERIKGKVGGFLSTAEKPKQAEIGNKGNSAQGPL